MSQSDMTLQCSCLLGVLYIYMVVSLVVCIEILLLVASSIRIYSLQHHTASIQCMCAFVTSYSIYTVHLCLCNIIQHYTVHVCLCNIIQHLYSAFVPLNHGFPEQLVVLVPLHALLLLTNS